ncbi:MAG: hypothetical protein ACRC20_01140 [Segniliparus sp.]|uniref:hypothetical protein n=1 Tax=Segniliparus sp. TaxID=2804064 RepID=UPI003F2E1C1E
MITAQWSAVAAAAIFSVVGFGVSVSDATPSTPTPAPQPVQPRGVPMPVPKLNDPHTFCGLQCGSIPAILAEYRKGDHTKACEDYRRVISGTTHQHELNSGEVGAKVGAFFGELIAGC